MQESVHLLETQVNNLKYEIETMDAKKRELIMKIAEAKDNVIKNTGSIDDMRETRDRLIMNIETLGQQSKVWRLVRIAYSSVVISCGRDGKQGEMTRRGKQGKRRERQREGQGEKGNRKKGGRKRWREGKQGWIERERGEARRYREGSMEM